MILPQVIPEPDTSVAVADSADALGEIGRHVGETGRLLASGEFTEAATQLSGGVIEFAIALVPQVFSALFVLILFFVAYRILHRVLFTLMNRSRHVDDGLQKLAMKSYRVIAWTFIVIMVLAQFGINVTALLAGLSIAGIAVGFAARDTLENLISGITILMDRPFKLGDNIEVDGTFGTVEDITFRSTRLKTLNNEIMVMPNLLMVNQKLINHTFLGSLRLEIKVGIAYKEHPAEARRALLAIFDEEDARIDRNHEPTVVVEGMGDSSVNLIVRFHIRDPLLERPIQYAYTEKVREALRKAGIEIPFPHLQLFIDEAKAFENRLLPGQDPAS